MQTQIIRKIGAKALATSTILALAYLLLTHGSVQPAKSANPAVAANPLIGIWDMTVQGQATYLYKYAISEGSWVTIGNIDGGYYNFRFGPTLGAYEQNPDGSYRYRETGWTYTRGGVCNGTFETTGTFVLDSSGTTFSGPGVFKQFDLTGKTILTEDLSVVATKLGV